MSEEKLYTQKELEMWVDSAKKGAIVCVAETKLDKKTFWTVFLFVIGIVISSITHLYILYYGGIAELGTGVALIQNEIAHIKEDIADIKYEINLATQPD